MVVISSTPCQLILAAVDYYYQVSAILDARCQHHFEFATVRQSSHSRVDSNHKLSLIVSVQLAFNYQNKDGCG